jgi:hypothetical protein
MTIVHAVLLVVLLAALIRIPLPATTPIVWAAIAYTIIIAVVLFLLFVPH